MYMPRVLYIAWFYCVVESKDSKRLLDLLKLSNKLEFPNDINNKVLTHATERPRHRDHIHNERNYDSDGEDGVSHLNKVLVKRVLPHGSRNRDMEYGKGVYYIPLVRIHRKTPVHADDKSRREKLSGNFHKVFDLSDEPSYEYHDQSESKIQEYHSNNQYEQLLKILRDVSGVIKKVPNKNLRYRAYQKVLGILKNIEVLRTVVEKSDEEIISGYNIVEEKPVEIDKNPHYPPWNYWTYKKTIHQDRCPEGQVKISNMCIWTPPH